MTSDLPSLPSKEEQLIPQGKGLFLRIAALSNSLPHGEARLEREERVVWHGYYEEGRLHGPSRWFFPTGELQRSTCFVRGNADGYHCSFYVHGTIEEEGEYKAGQKEGLWRRYDKTGRVCASLPYVGGRLSGTCELFYPDGLLKRTTSYVDGERHGVDTMWDRYGYPVFCEAWDKGVRTDTLLADIILLRGMS